jgi:ribose transport system permease protein
MSRLSRRIRASFSGYVPLALMYCALTVVFAALSDKFLTVENFVHILVQSSAVAVASVGMTFVLLTAGIDLSVGSVMFLTSAIAGVLVVKAGWPVAAALPAMVAIGALCGLANGLLIVRLRMAPFIVTLATLFFVRGLGLWVTETRAVNLPDAFRQLATARIIGIPSPVVIALLVLAVAHLILAHTAFGRQLYAVGYDRAAAEKAGVPVALLLLGVYVIGGACAATGGMITLAQLAAVSPRLGHGRELDVIAAAVLGGTSLFGGRGGAVGSFLGAVLIESITNGLNIIDADPYVYPVIAGVVIFLAVLLDSVRYQRSAALRRRRIRAGTILPSV